MSGGFIFFQLPALSDRLVKTASEIENNEQTAPNGVISVFNTDSHCTTVADLSSQKLLTPNLKSRLKLIKTDK